LIKYLCHGYGKYLPSISSYVVNFNSPSDPPFPDATFSDLSFLTCSPTIERANLCNLTATGGGGGGGGSKGDCNEIVVSVRANQGITERWDCKIKLPFLPQ
jgi:hypothetical protein